MLVPWLIRHVASVMSKFIIGNDGMTAYRRLKGKEFRLSIAEFGECVWYLKAKSDLKAKSGGVNRFDSRWDIGVWLGIRDESGEAVIGTNAGEIKTRSYRRKAIMNERWDK